MTQFQRKPGQPAFGIAPVAAACAAVFAFGAAQAQQATDQSLETVEVTGIRASIETAMSIKKNSDSIVEAVTAEDIGKLPDTSIAETIARLPGLTAQRVDGHAQLISIRGFAPDFAVTLLNGREMVSVDNNRSVQYDQFPSELMHGITVYKTPDASLAALGLSGTVDMATVQPLDMTERSIVVNARGQKNSLGALNPESKTSGGRFSFSYIDQLMDRKLGIAVGFAHLDSPSQEKHFGAWGYDTVGNSCLDYHDYCQYAHQNWGMPWNGTVDPKVPGITNAVILAGSEDIVYSRDQKRDGLMTTLEYKPNSSLHSTVDLYYSKFDKKEWSRGLMWSNDPMWWDGSNITNPGVTTVGDNLPMVTTGTYDYIRPVLQSNYNTENDKLWALGWKNELKSGAWMLTSDVSYSRAARKEDWSEMYAGLSNVNLTGWTTQGTDTMGFQLPFGSGFPTFSSATNWASPTQLYLTDPAGWGQDGFRRYQHMDDHMGALKLSGRRSLEGWFDNVETGVNYSSRSKMRSADGWQYQLTNGGDAAGQTAIPTQYLLAPTSLGFAGIPQVLSFNVQAIMADPSIYTPVRDQTQTVYDYLRNWTLSEKATTAYGKLGIDSHWGPLPVRGNLGIQVVHTNQASTGLANGDRGSWMARGADYTNVLPSLNLNLDISGLSPDLAGTFVRFGAARTMARPAMDDLRAGFSGSVGTTSRVWSGSAGNPGLHPWVADGTDVSVEKYFGKGSYVAAAGFYKNLRSYVYDNNIWYDFTGYPNPSAINPITPWGWLTQPANGSGGVVHGVELSAAIEGATINKALDGFGAMASASNTISNIDPHLSTIAKSGLPVPIGYKASLPGLSGLVSNWTAYYEKYGFGIRYSQTYRSAFLGQTPGPHGFFISTEIMAERVSSGQISYEFQQGQLKGLSLLLQGNNLGNTPYRTRLTSTATGGIAGTTNAPEQYNVYGRDILLGAAYKF